MKAKSRKGSAHKTRKTKRGGVFLPPLDRLQRYTIPEAALYLRKSRAQIYIDIKVGLIATIKEGKLRLVPGEEIARLSALPSIPAPLPSQFVAGSAVARSAAA
jgi:hypothetical protein